MFICVKGNDKWQMCCLYAFYTFESCDIRKLIKHLRELYMPNYNSHTVLAWKMIFFRSVVYSLGYYGYPFSCRILWYHDMIPLLHTLLKSMSTQNYFILNNNSSNSNNRVMTSDMNHSRSEGKQETLNKINLTS